MKSYLALSCLTLTAALHAANVCSPAQTLAQTDRFLEAQTQNEVAEDAINDGQRTLKFFEVKAKRFAEFCNGKQDSIISGRLCREVALRRQVLPLKVEEARAAFEEAQTSLQIAKGDLPCPQANQTPSDKLIPVYKRLREARNHVFEIRLRIATAELKAAKEFYEAANSVPGVVSSNDLLEYQLKMEDAQSNFDLLTDIAKHRKDSDAHLGDYLTPNK